MKKPCKEKIKEAIRNYEYFANGFHKLSGCSVKVLNLKVRKERAIADVVLIDNDESKRYNGNQYPLEELLKAKKKSVGSPKMHKKLKTSYICPNCKKKQNGVILWQTCSVAYEKDLKTGEEDYKDTVGGDFEAWACPECGEDLPEETTKKLGLF